MKKKWGYFQALSQINKSDKWASEEWSRSSTETVEGSALSLESVDNVESGDGLSLGVLGVGDRVSDDVLEEVSQDKSGLVVDEWADSLDTTSSGESSDGWLGHTHDGGLDGLLVESLGSGLAWDLSELAALSFVNWSHNDVW